MNFDTVSRHQKAVLWEFARFDNSGEPVGIAPVELKQVRWEHGQTEAIGEDGAPISYDATLFCSREIPLNSIVWEGKLVNVPDAPENLFIVRANETSPDTGNKHTNRVAMLQRYKSLPTVQ